MNKYLSNKNKFKFLSIILLLIFSITCQFSIAEAKKKYSKYRLQRFYVSPKITRKGAIKTTARLKKIGAYKVYINSKKNCIGIKYSKLKLTTIPIIKSLRSLGYRIKRIN